MEPLAPAERVAFLLHDPFSVPFDQIALIVERTPVTPKTLACRARQRVRGTPAAPELREARDLARAYVRSAGRRVPVFGLRLPGKVARGFRQGANLTPDHATGTITFEGFLAARARNA